MGIVGWASLAPVVGAALVWIPARDGLLPCPAHTLGGFQGSESFLDFLMTCLYAGALVGLAWGSVLFADVLDHSGVLLSDLPRAHFLSPACLMVGFSAGIPYPQLV